jgi:Zn-dependent protease with chaperone function
MTTPESSADNETTREGDTVPLSSTSDVPTAPPPRKTRAKRAPAARTTAVAASVPQPDGEAAAVAPGVVGDGDGRPPASSKLVAVGMYGVDGVPDRYPDGVAWLKNGIRRHPWAVGVGLVTGWTGVWFAFWAAVAGLILGVFVALGLTGSSDAGIFLFHIGAYQAVTVVGVVLGGILGAVGGFLIVPKLIFIDHPFSALVSLALGAVLTGAIVIFNATYERPMLRFRGYRRLSRDEVRRIAPLVKNVADAMDLPALPRFGMDDVLVPNAWTHMRTIILTRGLLQTLDDGELSAVLAHELQHWRSGDAVGGHIVWAAAWPVALLYNLGSLLAGTGHGEGETGGPPRKAPHTFLALFGWFIAWPAWVITKFILVPLTAHTQRGYEYAADAAAARIGLATQLSSALKKMGAFEGGRSGWEQAMAATHPPTELRLEALQAPRPDDYEYQEEDLRVPTQQEVRRFLFGLREVVVPKRAASEPPSGNDGA